MPFAIDYQDIIIFILLSNRVTGLKQYSSLGSLTPFLSLYPLMHNFLVYQSFCLSMRSFFVFKRGKVSYFTLNCVSNTCFPLFYLHQSHIPSFSSKSELYGDKITCLGPILSLLPTHSRSFVGVRRGGLHAISL